MEKKNRNRRQRAEARDLARTSGMKYTEALRLIRAAAGGSDEWPAFDALEPDLEGSVVGACRWALERDALGESLNSLLSEDDWEDFDLPDGLTVDHLMVDESVSSFNQDERIEPDRVLGHAIIEAELTILGFEMAAFDANRLVDRGLVREVDGDLMDSDPVQLTLIPFTIEAIFGAHVDDLGEYPEVELQGVVLKAPQLSDPVDLSHPWMH